MSDLVWKAFNYSLCGSKCITYYCCIHVLLLLLFWGDPCVQLTETWHSSCVSLLFCWFWLLYCPRFKSLWIKTSAKWLNINIISENNHLQMPLALIIYLMLSFTLECKHIRWSVTELYWFAPLLRFVWSFSWGHIKPWVCLSVCVRFADTVWLTENKHVWYGSETGGARSWSRAAVVNISTAVISALQTLLCEAFKPVTNQRFRACIKLPKRFQYMKL